MYTHSSRQRTHGRVSPQQGSMSDRDTKHAHRQQHHHHKKRRPHGTRFCLCWWDPARSRGPGVTRDIVLVKDEGGGVLAGRTVSGVLCVCVCLCLCLCVCVTDALSPVADLDVCGMENAVSICVYGRMCTCLLHTGTHPFVHTTQRTQDTHIAPCCAFAGTLGARMWMVWWGLTLCGYSWDGQVHGE